MNMNSKFRACLCVMCLFVARFAEAACAPGIQTVRERVASHAAVFVGQVLEIRQPTTNRQSKATKPAARSGPEVIFEVSMAWKGVHEHRLVASDNLIFESGVTVGAQFLIFATREGSDPRLLIMGCGDTQPYKQ